MAIDQITTGIIKNDAVTADKIVAGAVVADVAADSITNTHMADDAIDSAQLAAGAVDTAHLGNLQVTAAKVAADVATTAGSQTVSIKTLVAPALGTPASGVATNLTAIPAAAVGGVLPVGVTGGSGLDALSVKFPRNENLIIKKVNDTTVDIDADYLSLYNASNIGYLASSVNLTANIAATAGINSMETGGSGEAASTWYHLWVIYNGTTVASLISISTTSPTMPSGYTYKKYVGSVYNDSSSNFRDFDQEGNDVTFGVIQAHGSAENGSYLEVNISPEVPTTATKCSGYMYGATSNSPGGSYVGAIVASDAAGFGFQYAQVEAYASGQRLVCYSPFSDLLIKTTQRI